MRFIRLRKIIFYRFEKHFFYVALMSSLFFIHATFMDIFLSYSYYKYVNRNDFIKYENSRYAVECFEAGVFPVNYVVIVLIGILFFVFLLACLKYLLYKIDKCHIKKTKALIHLSQFVFVASIVYTITSSYLAGLTWYDNTYIVYLFHNSFSESSKLLVYMTQLILIVSLIPLVMRYFEYKKEKECIAIWFSNLDGDKK